MVAEDTGGKRKRAKPLDLGGDFPKRELLEKLIDPTLRQNAMRQAMMFEGRRVPWKHLLFERTQYPALVQYLLTMPALHRHPVFVEVEPAQRAPGPSVANWWQVFTKPDGTPRSRIHVSLYCPTKPMAQQLSYLERLLVCGHASCDRKIPNTYVGINITSQDQFIRWGKSPPVSSRAKGGASSATPSAGKTPRNAPPKTED